jgi:hypothetical protein
MKTIFIRFFVLLTGLVFSISLAYSQSLTEICTLSNEVNETSGLLLLNQKIITHNDSGGEAALYEIDSITGSINRKVIIKNASNNDWEDICSDDEFIYIGDFGNNSGSRTDLKIYRIPINEYLENPSNEANAEIIRFSYSDQSDFTPTFYTTNFDAEALIAYNDSLYIFTKNWSDVRSNVYSVSKKPGTYQINKIDSFNAQALVTGAYYNAEYHTLVLTAYNFFAAYIIEISQFTSNQFSKGNIEKYSIQPQGSIQIESIAGLKSNHYYLTSEESTSGSSKLYRLKAKNLALATDLIQTLTPEIYPNPAKKQVNIQIEKLDRIEIYDIHGKLQKTVKEKKIDIANFETGIYFLAIYQKENEFPLIGKLIIE